LVLYRHDGINQEELSNYLKIDKGTTARAIGKLEQEGYVYRMVNPEDRRANQVFITDRAREIQPIIYGVLGEWNDIMVKNLTDEEQSIAQTVLMKMVDNTIAFVNQDDLNAL
jgi:DNA-binding MarR family transcriptional regulator